MINSHVGYKVQCAVCSVQCAGEARKGDSRGRHTSAASELVLLANGGWLPDTPDLPGVDLWLSSTVIVRVFADVFEASNNYRFRDCEHENEPPYGVHDAVANNEFTADRVANMKTLVAEEATLGSQQICMHARTQDKCGVRKPQMLVIFYVAN